MRFLSASLSVLTEKDVVCVRVCVYARAVYYFKTRVFLRSSILLFADVVFELP